MAPSNKAERLLDLVILLLSASRPMTVAEIRERIPGYGHQSGDTFHRMFERDKADLREMDLPLEQEETVNGIGYRVRARDALLEDPGLTPDEQAALALAARVWEGAEAGSGWLKLAAVSGETGEGPAGFMLPRVAMTPATSKVLDAVARRKRVTFRYRAASGELRDRTVEPHGLILHRGQWYLTGQDVDAGAGRHFKLSRVDGRIAVNKGRDPDFDPPPGSPDAPRAPWEGEAAEEALIEFSWDTAWSVQRRSGVRLVDERPGGASVLAVPFSDLPTFAAWVAGFGRRALVLEPPALRDAVVGRLRALAGRGA